MAQIAGLSDSRQHGPPADIGTFQFTATAMVFQFTFSGITYTVAMAAGVGGWTLIAQSTAGADEVEINAAIVYANALGGGLVHIKQGTYNFDDQILPLDDIILEGSGVGTVLNETTFTLNRILVHTKSNVVLRDFKLNVNLSPNGDGGSGIILYFCTQIYSKI